MNEQYNNVIETWQIYDCVRIGKNVPSKYPGGFNSFVQMALADEIPFLNIRNSSEAGLAYTNVSSKDKLPWPFWLESIGLRFLYPDPESPANPAPLLGDNVMGKMFQQVIQEHAYFQFQIREDTIVTLKPAHMPAGMGPSGYISSIGGITSMGTVITQGQANMGNRWKFQGKPLNIPRDTPIKGILKFSDTGKQLLTAMGAPGEIPFGAAVWTNEAMIELTLRGKRGVQQRGEYHYD